MKGRLLHYFKRYDDCLIAYPYPVRMATTGLFCFCGDIIAQYFSRDKSKKWRMNWDRNFRQVCFGFFWVGPILGYYYAQMLPRIFPAAGQSRLALTLKKLLFDAVCFNPIYTLSIFPVLNFLYGKSVEQTKKDVKDKYPTTLKISWCVWSTVNFCNFMIIPIRY